MIPQRITGFKPTILIRFSSGSYPALTHQVKEIYSHYESEIPFEATLFRDLTPYTYLSLPSRLVGTAFVIALLLACMGFFGLASFTSENRTKEIGIRKASGSTTPAVMSLLLGSYTKWLIISFLIALPVAYILGKNFLEKSIFIHQCHYGLSLQTSHRHHYSLTHCKFTNMEGCQQKSVKSLRYE